MDSTGGGKVCKQIVELVFVFIVVAVGFFFAGRVGMSLSACLASLALGVLLRVGLDALRGRLWGRYDADR